MLRLLVAPSFAKKQATRLLRILAMAGIALLVSPPQSIAYEMTPLELSLEPTGRKASGNFAIANTGDDPIAIQLNVFTREMTNEGADILRPADEDFVVFPPQMIVRPRQTQTVRVQYTGGPTGGSERAYRLIAEQLPIDLGAAPDDDGGMIRVLIRYVASVYVGPRTIKPAIRVIQAVPAPDDRMRIVMRNEGSQHALLTGVTLRIGDVVLADQQLAGLLGENILAGVTRTFHVPWPAGVPRQPVTVELNNK